MKTTILTLTCVLASIAGTNTDLFATASAPSRICGTSSNFTSGFFPQGNQGLRRNDRSADPAQDEANLRMTPVVKAVQRAASSVVSVYVVRSSLMDRAGAQRANGQGSGVVIDANGLIITNWHVVVPVASGGDFGLKVTTKSGKTYRAKLLSSSPDWDLALLQINLRNSKEKLTPVAFGESESLMLGETVIAIGNPQGHANTVTVGVLSNLDRNIKVQTPDGNVREYSNLLQTDAAINQGNSGGALLNINGKLVGINNAMGRDVENIGFAIPVDTVKRVFRDVLLSSENFASIWIGMTVNEDSGHVVVAQVDPDGPAKQAGVRKGDRIIEVNGVAVKSKLDYARQTLNAQPGQTFPLHVERRGRSYKFGPKPLSVVTHELTRRVGMEVEQVAAPDDHELLEKCTREFYRDSRFRRFQILPAVMRITRIVKGGSADKLGLKKGDILIGMTTRNSWGREQNIGFDSPQDLVQKLRGLAGQSATIILMREDQGYTGDLSVLK